MQTIHVTLRDDEYELLMLLGKPGEDGHYPFVTLSTKDKRFQTMLALELLGLVQVTRLEAFTRGCQSTTAGVFLVRCAGLKPVL